MFSPDAGKYGPEKTSYLDTFCTVSTIMTTTKTTTISSYKEKILLIYLVNLLLVDLMLNFPDLLYWYYKFVVPSTIIIS